MGLCEAMGIEVYPQLSSVLAERGLTAEDVARQIRDQFGLNVSVTMVTQLAQQGSLHAANIEVAVAAAQVLGIGLDDLFISVAHRVATDEERTPLDEKATTSPHSIAEDNQPIYFKGYSQEEIASLLDDHTYEYPGSENQGHVANLIDEYGRVLYDRHLGAYASEREITIKQARMELTTSYAALVEWQRAFEADPKRQEAVRERARNRGQRSGERSACNSLTESRTSSTTRST